MNNSTMNYVEREREREREREESEGGRGGGRKNLHKRRERT
jgi:hypothetical protein